MKYILVIAMLLVSCGSASAYGYMVTTCPANKDVEITFNWYLNASNTFLHFATNTESRSNVGNYLYATNQEQKIKARSNASGATWVSWFGSAGSVMSGWSCAEVAAVGSDGKEYALMIGGLCGLAFALAVASRI